MARKLVILFHQQPKEGYKLNNDHKSLSYRPSPYFMRKINAFRHHRRIFIARNLTDVVATAKKKKKKKKKKIRFQVGSHLLY